MLLRKLQNTSRSRAFLHCRIDFEEEPPFFEITPTHYAKTWLCDPRVPFFKRPKAIEGLHQKMVMIYQGGNVSGNREERSFSFNPRS